jgi:hypothetical protein
MRRERGAQDVDGVLAQQVLEAGDVGEAAPVAGGHGRAFRERGLGRGAQLAAGLVHPEQMEPRQAVGDRERLARRRAAGAVEDEVALFARGAAQAVQRGPNAGVEAAAALLAGRHRQWDGEGSKALLLRRENARF